MRWRMRTTRRDAHVKDDVPVGRRENFTVSEEKERGDGQTNSERIYNIPRAYT